MYKEKCNKEQSIGGIKVYERKPKEDDGSPAFARIRDYGPYRFIVTMVSPPNVAHQNAVDLMSEFVRELHSAIGSVGDGSLDDSIIGAAIVDDIRSVDHGGKIAGYLGLRDYPTLPRDDQEAADEVMFYIDAIGHERVGSEVYSSKVLKLSGVHCHPDAQYAIDHMHQATWVQPWENLDSGENHVYEVTPSGLKY